jgi:opacity protein-like surface antigen
VRINYELQEATDEYRLFTETPTGQYIDREGALLGPPDFFVPDDRTGSTLGGGVAASHRFSDLVTAGVAYDIERWDIEGLNESERHSAQVSEERPYSIGQAVLAGRIGPQFEWAADGRSWRSGSQANWNFTLSAGLGGTPLIGVGKLLERDEEGSALRTRARYDFGDFELNGAFTTAYRQIEITPPLPEDRTSFNYFRNSLQSRTGADTLALPDSVSHDVSEERSWEGAGGGSWSLNARTIVAAEFHYYEARLDQQSSGQGPLRSRWDVRGGVEMQLSPVLAGRGGYMYRQDDLDDFTQQNEVLSHTFTLGLGLHPPESSWILETGYYFEWLRSDFGDPTEYHAGRQQLLGQIRWSF